MLFRSLPHPPSLSIPLVFLLSILLSLPLSISLSPFSLSPALPFSRLVKRQHKCRAQCCRRNRLGGPGLSYDAPCHKEPGFWKTPSIRQRHKQILQLSSSPNLPFCLQLLITPFKRKRLPLVTAVLGHLNYYCFLLMFSVSFKHVTGAYCNLF